MTFLFTDIEGSTRRWQLFREQMHGALERHDRVLASVVEDHGGTVFKHTGDGLGAVFGNVPDAVACAVAAQRALAAQDWSSVGGIAVRIGIHTGDAELRDGDYFGPALARAVRVMSAGHGGQVLLSGATAALSADLDDDVALVPLGTFRLRGIAAPERLVQVVADGLRADFPPPATAETGRNLPVPRSSFVGRDGELSALAERLESARLLTLTGPGGVGKTRLALELARRVGDRYPEGLHFVELAAVAEEDLVVPTVAAAVRLDTGAGADALLAALERREILLLLDNCEHLVDACAALADDILDRCPGVTLVATSREPLSIDGEHVWRVPSLGLGDAEEEGDAVRLFAERARSVHARFDPSAHERAVSEICRRLDGIPLALELAAAQLAHLSVDDVAARLDDRFTLLAGGRRRVQRQATLEATLDWSYELLRADEQLLLRRLGAFAGDFALDDVEAVCVDEALARDRVLPLLHSLADKSMVSVQSAGTTTRYRLLESVRLYALDRLSRAGELTTARDRHCDHYVSGWGSVPIAHGWSSFSLAAAQQHEIDNLRSALEWCRVAGRDADLARLATSLVSLWCIRGHVDEGERWLVLATDRDLEPRLRATCLVARSVIAMQRGDWWLCPQYNRDALDLVDDGDERVAALTWLAWNLQQENREEVVRLLREADALCRTDNPYRAFISSVRAAAALWHETPEAVLPHLLRTDELVADAAGFDLFAYLNRQWLVIQLHVLGRHDEAAEWAHRVPAPDAASWQYVEQLATAYALLGQGDAEEAARHVATAGRLALRRGVHLAENDCLTAFAAVAVAAGEHERACSLLATSTSAEGLTLRHPSSYAAYLHYRDRVRAEVDRDRRQHLLRLGRRRSAREVLVEELTRTGS